MAEVALQYACAEWLSHLAGPRRSDSFGHVCRLHKVATAQTLLPRTNLDGRARTLAWQTVSVDIDPELENEERNARKSEKSGRKVRRVHLAAIDCSLHSAGVF